MFATRAVHTLGEPLAGAAGRAYEAARFNRESTGPGLTIVRHVAQAAGGRRTGGKGRREMAYLMVADDDEDFASAIAKVLQDAGHEVEIKLDIRSAVESMEERRPDLLILDVVFHEDSTAGFTLARTIRHYNEKLKGIPVLMLTAVNTKFPLGFSDRDIDDHWLPVSDFVEKPVDFDVLKEKVGALLSQAASGQGRENAGS